MDPIMPQMNLCRIAKASVIETRQHKARADHDLRWAQIFEVKEVYALTKDLRLMVLFHLLTVPGVGPPKALL
jgi:hypothetical protein